MPAQEAFFFFFEESTRSMLNKTVSTKKLLEKASYSNTPFLE
jgi:hypothetical protein